MDITSKPVSLINMLRRYAEQISLKSKNDYSNYVNTPIKFIREEWYVNERIVEIAFAHKHISFNGIGKRALEFGCTRSELALQLASLGYEVLGVDLRKYPFTHPRLKFFQHNILDFEDDEGYDYITAISVIEHIGLGAYGETRRETDLQLVMNKLSSILKPGGVLIITVPFGQAYQDKFLRSFTRADVVNLFKSDDINLVDEKYFCRTEFKFWQPCDHQDTVKISNAKSDCGPTGVNCVGCFAWQNAVLSRESIK